MNSQKTMEQNTAINTAEKSFEESLNGLIGTGFNTKEELEALIRKRISLRMQLTKAKVYNVFTGTAFHTTSKSHFVVSVFFNPKGKVMEITKLSVSGYNKTVMKG